MSLPRTPPADTKTASNSPNIGASPALQSPPPLKIPPEPPDRKSPLPTAPPLDRTKSDLDPSSLLPPLIQELMFSEKQLSLGSGKQVRFKPAPLIHEVRSLHISDSPPGAASSDFSKEEVGYSSTPTGIQSQTQPGQFTVSAPQSRRGRSPPGGGGGDGSDDPGDGGGGSQLPKFWPWFFRP